MSNSILVLINHKENFIIEYKMKDIREIEIIIK